MQIIWDPTAPGSESAALIVDKDLVVLIFKILSRGVMVVEGQSLVENRRKHSMGMSTVDKVPYCLR
jgi:translation initiation factor RLI1